MTDVIAILVGVVAMFYAAVQVQRFEQGLKPHTWHVTYKIDPPNNDGRWRSATIKLYAVGSAEIPDVHINVIGDVQIAEDRTPDLLGSTHGPAEVKLIFRDASPAYLVLTYGSCGLLTGRTIQQGVRVRLDSRGLPEVSHWKWSWFLGFRRYARGKWVVTREPKRRSQWHIPGLQFMPSNDLETSSTEPKAKS